MNINVMNNYDLVPEKPSWANSSFYDEYDRDRFESSYRRHHEHRLEEKNKIANESSTNYKITDKWQRYDQVNTGYSNSNILPREYSQNTIQRHQENQENEPNEDRKCFSYCYLCSIKGHVHTKTEPVPISKRRYLKPYVNPLTIIKKYEENQLDTELKMKYKIVVKTGEAQFAGTDCNVFIKVFGTAGTWNQTELKPSTANKDAKFPSNSSVEIEIDGPMIGDMRKLKIWHTGKTIKEGWLLEFVEITCIKLKQSWKFVCDKWLSKHKAPDYKPSAVILSNEQIKSQSQINPNATEYLVILKTSERAIPFPDLNVQFQFVGSKGQSTIFNLISPYVTLFDAYQLDSFLISSSTDIGKPEKLRMAIENGGKKFPYEWNVDELKVIYSKDPNKFYTFKLEKWIEKNSKLNAAITPGPAVNIDKSVELEKGKMIYHVTVITGASKLAGTDANVFIEIAGSGGNTNIHRLHNPKMKREFERNQTNHFHLFDNNIGQIKAIRIFHDNSGTAPGWQLDTVLIKCVSTQISGKKENYDSDLKDQLNKLRKKFKIREMNLKIPDNVRGSRRSSSADFSKSPEIKSLPKRSISANSSNEKKKESDDSKSNQIPTSSILKTSSSPRNRRKHVKFNSKDFYHQISDENKSIAAPTKPKLEMKLNWIMSVANNDQGQIKSLKTIENFDKTIKAIDDRYIAKYDSIFKQEVTDSKSKEETPKSRSPRSTSVEDLNAMYVFECKKWLAKDSADRKIERIIKVTSILNS